MLGVLVGLRFHVPHLAKPVDSERYQDVGPLPSVTLDRAPACPTLAMTGVASLQ
jgi:hypothetical protein